MNQFNGNQVGNLINNAILTTAMIANEVCIQSKGEWMLPEQDYAPIIQNFQLVMSKKIMPPKTHNELKEEIKKYVTEIIKQLSEGESNDKGIGGDNGEDGRDNVQPKSNIISP